jgi:hypothetical protein
VQACCEHASSWQKQHAAAAPRWVDALSAPPVFAELNCCCRCRVETLSCVEPEEVQYIDFVEEGRRLARELRVSSQLVWWTLISACPAVFDMLCDAGVVSLAVSWCLR